MNTIFKTENLLTHKKTLSAEYHSPDAEFLNTLSSADSNEIKLTFYFVPSVSEFTNVMNVLTAQIVKLELKDGLLYPPATLEAIHDYLIHHFIIQYAVLTDDLNQYALHTGTDPDNVIRLQQAQKVYQLQRREQEQADLSLKKLQNDLKRNRASFLRYKDLYEEAQEEISQLKKSQE